MIIVLIFYCTYMSYDVIYIIAFFSHIKRTIYSHKKTKLSDNVFLADYSDKVITLEYNR